MPCDISEEQLWNWIDDNAPELDTHLAECPRCRRLAAEIRAGIQAVAVGSTPLSPPLPEKIGSYVVKRLLGEGGQGLVYEAEQQTPRRVVAVKVLRGGRFVSAHDLRHFQREIQSLASLQHPGIATIHEAGRTEEGQHFFAMELVGGVPLDVYIHENDIAMQARLELFGKVCDAVHYAHQQGVIHRDLKPTNILVDAEGNPRILDFGLARLTDADVTLMTTATDPGQVLGTLRYMSPEQARGEPEAIGVQSDVYALGVILYELLIDQSPYDVARSMPAAVQTICEESPRRPSAVNRTLRGDLETIALKALEKEPVRRYQSAEALGEDVRRYLSGEPILARRPCRLYVLRKRLSKHRLAVALAGAAVVLGAIGLVGGAWWNKRSVERRHAREIAGQSQAREQQQARELHDARVAALIVQRYLEMGRVQTASAEASALLSRHPTLPEARLVWAQTQFKVARQAGNEGTNLRDLLINTLKGTFAYDPSRWEVRALLGEIYGAIGNPEADQLIERARRDMPDTAEAWYLWSFTTLDLDEAVRCAEEALQRDHKHTLAWERLAYLCLQTNRYDRALTAASELIDHGGDRLGWMIFQGRVLTEAGRYREAIELYTQAVDLAPDQHQTYRGRGVAFLCERNYVRAIEDFGKVLELEGPGDIWARYFRATPLWIAGRTAEAAEEYRKVREVRGQISYQDARRFLVLHDHAGRLQEQGRLADAERVRKEADAVLEADCRGVTPGGPVERILKCLAGKLSPEALVTSADRENLEEVCETCYYAGEACLLNGRDDEARKFFQMCVETNLVLDPNSRYPDPMNEYHLAVWRLEQLDIDAAAASRPARP